MRRLLLSLGLLLPVSVCALSYENLGLLYNDAPFIAAENAGISVLTSLGVVQGNPDGTFMPKRTLNRAEFLKIALLSYPKIRVSMSDAGNCFPDVQEVDWFSPYVCLAKQRQVISGYPDGYFRPERSVNYAEALKILSELYEYVAYSTEDEPWYAGYVRASEFHKTALPINLQYDMSLTRGQMARLAAAFRAEYEGELDVYRLAEKDLFAAQQEQSLRSTSSSSISSVSSVSSETSISSASSTSFESSSSSASSIAPLFPAKSHHILLGQSQVIGNALFAPREGDALVGNVTVEFRNEVKNLDALYLIDVEGNRLAELVPDVYDNEDKTWKSRVDQQIHYVLPEGGEVLGLLADIKHKQQEGFAEELIQVRWISLNVSEDESEGGGYQVLGSSGVYPSQQTVQARITNVLNNNAPVMDLSSGASVVIAEFLVEGTALEGASLALEEIRFTIAERRGVELSNLRLGALSVVETSPCYLSQGETISCPSIPSSIGTIAEGSVIVQLRGDVTIDTFTSDPQIQIDIRDAGSISTSIEQGEIGDVLWTDGTGHYKWVELLEPLAEGSLLQ